MKDMEWVLLISGMPKNRDPEIEGTENIRRSFRLAP
jgi:hypothetical protein